MMSSPSRLRVGEIVSLVPLKTRSVSELIAGIKSISNAIWASCGDAELAYHVKRLLLANRAVNKTLR
jgi:hypothetical protein